MGQQGGEVVTLRPGGGSVVVIVVIVGVVAVNLQPLETRQGGEVLSAEECGRQGRSLQ